MNELTIVQQRRRGAGLRALFATLVAALPVLAPTLAGADVVRRIDPDARTRLVIHKFEQPQDFGDTATGLPLDQASLDQLVPLPAATFRPPRIPATTLPSNAGWESAPELTVAKAEALTEKAEAEASGRTDGEGRLTLDLGVGIYLVEETDLKGSRAPDGAVPSAPFLVTLPMTAPDSNDRWLSTVHVYPKNARAAVEFIVSDAITCVPKVWWTSRTGIPRVTELDRYVVRNILAPGVELAGGSSDISVAVDGAPGLERGAHYTVELGSDDDGRAVVEVAFTKAGRAALLADRAADAGAEVSIAYPTRLVTPGTHQHAVRLRMDDAKEVEGTAATTYKTDCGPGESPSPSPSPSPSGPPKPPDLPGTGARISGAFLVIAVLLVGGGLALVRRGQRDGNG